MQHPGPLDHVPRHSCIPAFVLMLDVAGMPIKWAGVEEAAVHVATDRVAWSLGDPKHAIVLRGGINAASGLQSTLSIPSILAVKASDRHARYAHASLALPARSNLMLFRRDRNTCAYCGEVFAPRFLTREHVVPQSLGGEDSWTNCVTACRDCNQAKGDRRVEDFKPLLFVPYVPCRNEAFILARRTILADQMEFLASRLPKHSRVLAF